MVCRGCGEASLLSDPRGYTGGLQGIGAIASRRKFHACCTTPVPRDVFLHPNMVVRLLGGPALFLPYHWHGISATASHYCLYRIGAYTKIHFLTNFPIRSLSYARMRINMHNAGDIPLTEWRFALRKILLSSSGVRGIPAWSFF